MTRTLVAACLTGLLVAGCTRGDPGEPASSPSTAPTAAPTSAAPSTDAPLLADPPGANSSLWLDTVGIPVVAAIRTSTELARLAEVDPAARAATCQQVARDLDAIAPPQVLTGLAITADAETATLLVADLQAKADLLAACEAGGDDLERLVAEVEHTHGVAVAWLDVLGGDA